MQPMRFWRPRSLSSTKSPICARKWAQMFRRWLTASAWTIVSAEKFFMAERASGGPCFPKNIRALIKTGHDHDISLRIVEAMAAANDIRKRAMARKVANIFSGSLRGKTVAVLGLSFKPNTDDLREAPSLALITALQDMGARVRAFDPAGMAKARVMLKDVTYGTDPLTVPRTPMP